MQSEPHPGHLPEYREKGQCEKPLIGAVAALVIASLGGIPVLIWNSRHNWVSFRHVARQTGASAGAFNLGSIFMIAGGLYAMRHKASGDDPNRSKLQFLLWIGGSFFAINLLASFRAKVQPNWPAPAYFTLLILAAYFISTKLRNLQSWKRWRGLFWLTILIGLVMIPPSHDTSPVVPLFERIAKAINPKTDDIDPLARLRGWRTLGVFVARELNTLRPRAFVMCDDYQQTAEMGFYVPFHPRTYCAGSYFGKRLSQYDMWADRNLDSSSPLVGRDAVYVGKGGALPKVVFNAFEEVEKLPELPIMVNGSTVRTFKVWRCRGFRGLARASDEIEY